MPVWGENFKFGGGISPLKGLEKKKQKKKKTLAASMTTGMLVLT